MTSFTTSGSVVSFDTSGTAVTFAVTTAPTAFTTSPTVTPGAHASTHGAGGADPITTLGAVAHSGQQTFAAGSAAGPSIAFTGDTNTGIYSPTADKVAIATGGAQRVLIDSGGLASLADVSAANVTATSALYSNDGTTVARIIASGGASYWGNTSNHPVVVQTNNTERLGISSTGQITTGLGSAGTPVLSFSGDTNTGIYSPGADQVGIATAGTARVTVDSAGKVGINNGSPTARLDVSNDRAAASYAFAINTYNGVTFENSFVAQFDGSVQLFGNYQNFPVGLLANNTERFRVDGAGLITGTGTSLGAWTSYTPSLTASTTNPTLGSGSAATGAYCQLGKIVHTRVKIAFGTSGTAAGSGTYYVSLPVTPKAYDLGAGGGWIYDASTGAFNLVNFRFGAGSTVALVVEGASYVTDASPWAWAASDEICIGLTYEAA